MKPISEIGLELIELEDQVLLVDKRIQPVNNWYFDTYIKKVKNTSGAEYAKDSQVIQIICSTKPLEGLPLLVIEDEVETAYYEDNDSKIYGEDLISVYREGYNKAKSTYKFTEEDLRKAISMARDYPADVVGYQKEEIIQSLTKKEPWIEIEMVYYPANLSSEDRAPYRPKITDGKIKAIWK